MCLIVVLIKSEGILDPHILSTLLEIISLKLQVQILVHVAVKHKFIHSMGRHTAPNLVSSAMFYCGLHILLFQLLVRLSPDRYVKF